ncbi:MAG: hypothetical protein JJU11_17245 [Candidatus Sumerlaeia bacterium]|nr:hypothetical protein [Candidatus Sumerlaeia bacterium]
MMSRRHQAALFFAPLSLLILFFFLADLFLSPRLLREWHWAGIQLWAFPIPYRVFAALAPLLVLLLPSTFFTSLVENSRRLYTQTAQGVNAAPWYALALAVPLLWVFRSTTLAFGDSLFFAGDVVPREAMSERGVLLTYDSIGVTVIYSYGHRILNFLTSSDPVTTYNLIGVVSLLVFLAWARVAWRKGYLLGAPVVLVVLFLGSWSQATMAPVENYVQKLLFLLAFGILGVESLAGRQPVWKACLAYSLGAFFHLGVAWIFPALVYLLWRRMPRESADLRMLAVAAMVIPAMMTGMYAYFWGFDLSFFMASNAGMGKIIPLIDPSHPYTGMYYQYSTFDPRHLYHIMNQAILTGYPGLLLLLGGLGVYNWRTFAGENREGIFLLVFFMGALLFNLLWNPDLEFWADQDLFSVIGLSICLLGAWAFWGPPGRDLSPEIRTRILAAVIVGGLAWRLPVLLYHSVLSPNYLTPEVLRIVYPFP